MTPTNEATQGGATLSLAELAAVLGAALGAGYDGVRSGRVRNLPDARTIRWYQTLGIVDRPAAFHGRTALYARRHVLQLAAIKKLQAAGFSLADVQRGLAGKTDAELARAAGLGLADIDRRLAAAHAACMAANDARLHAAIVTQPAQGRAAGKFWSVRPTAAATKASAPAAEEAPAEDERDPSLPRPALSLGSFLKKEKTKIDLCDARCHSRRHRPRMLIAADAAENRSVPSLSAEVRAVTCRKAVKCRANADVKERSATELPPTTAATTFYRWQIKRPLTISIPLPEAPGKNKAGSPIAVPPEGDAHSGDPLCP